MKTLNQPQEKSTVFVLWKHCRDLFVTQSAPSIWFDPRPDRRVRRNTWRRFGSQRCPTDSRCG